MGGHIPLRKLWGHGFGRSQSGHLVSVTHGGDHAGYCKDMAGSRSPRLPLKAANTDLAIGGALQVGCQLQNANADLSLVVIFLL